MQKEGFKKTTNDLSTLESILEKKNIDDGKSLNDTSPDPLDESYNYKSYQKIKEDQLAGRSLKFIHDIISSSSKSSKKSGEEPHKEITLSPETTTTTKDSLFVAASKTPNPTKERVETKKPAENKYDLSAEDIKIQKAIYKDIEFWKEKLTREYEDEKMNKINRSNLLDLQSNPYKWLKTKLENQSKKLKAELKDSNNSDTQIQEKLKSDLLKKEEALKRLKDSVQKNIPLKIEGDFTPSSIKLDRGLQFNITKHTEEINKSMGIASLGYSIEDVIQRANKRLLVVKTAEGKIVEIPMQKIYELTTSNTSDPEAIIKKIRKGDVFEVTQNGKNTIYNIVDRTKDTITYTKDKIHGTSTIEQLTKLLSQEGVSAKNLTLEKTTVTSKKSAETKKDSEKDVKSTITPETPETAKQEVEISRSQLKEFINEVAIGDSIKAAAGHGILHTFTVLDIKDDNITIISDIHKKEATMKKSAFEEFVLNSGRINSITKAKKEEAPKLEPVTEPEIEITKEKLPKESASKEETSKAGVPTAEQNEAYEQLVKDYIVGIQETIQLEAQLEKLNREIEISNQKDIENHEKNTTEELKEERRGQIIKELKKEWETKNGPMERPMTKAEIEETKSWEIINGRKWDGETTRMTDAASEFFYDHRGKGKFSVPSRADKILAERFPEYAGKEDKGGIEILGEAQLNTEIEKIIKENFAKVLEEKGLVYKGLDIANTKTGFTITAKFEGGWTIGKPKFIATIESIDGKIIVLPGYKLDANVLVKAFTKQEDIDNLANMLGEKMKAYIEKDRKKEVERIDIENGSLKIMYK